MVFLQAHIGILLIFAWSLTLIIGLGSLLLTVYFNHTMRKKIGPLTWAERFDNFGKAVGISLILCVLFVVVIFLVFRNVEMD